MWCFPVAGVLMVKGQRLEASKKGLIVKTEDEAKEVAKVLFLDHTKYAVKKEVQAHFLKSAEKKTTTQINQELVQKRIEAQKRSDAKALADKKAKAEAGK